MTQPSPSILNIRLKASDNVDASIASAISQLKKNDELHVTLNDGFKGIVHSELLLLDNLLLAAKRYDFELLSSPYDGQSKMRFRYLGLEMPNGLTFAYSKDFISGVRSLFLDVFGHPLSEKFWRWKYDHGPKAYSAVLLKDKEVVAHYGVIPRKLRFLGSSYTALQSADVMVQQSSRGKITSSNLALIMEFGLKQFDTSTEFLTEDSPICFFGFPHGRKLKLGERLLQYKNLGNLFDISVTPESFQESDFGLDKNLVLVSERSELKPIWSRAWKRMEQDTDDIVMGERDWLYGQRRYLCHPEHEYFCLTDQNTVDIVLVLRKIGDESYQLTDYVGPIQYMSEYVAAAYRYLKNARPKVQLHLWQLERFANPFVSFSNLTRTKAALSAKFLGDAEFLELEQWWITMGDTDFL